MEKYKKQLVRGKARYRYKIRQQCSIKYCKDLGERHHPDYSKPFDIIWLCRKHHEYVHHSNMIRCSFENCSNKHLARGFCRKHYYIILEKPVLLKENGRYMYKTTIDSRKLKNRLIQSLI